MSELAFQSAHALAARIRNRELGSEELLRFYLDRVDRYNPEINAVIWQRREAALAFSDGVSRQAGQAPEAFRLVRKFASA